MKMKDSLKQILEADGMDLTLEDILRGKLEHRKESLKHLKEVKAKRSTSDLMAFSEEDLGLYFTELWLKDELEVLDREINRIAFHYSQVLTIQSAKKCFKTRWVDIMSRLELIDIVDVVSLYTDVRNPNYLVRCPIHDDKTASLKIYQNTNSFYCFGCCKGGGSVNLVMLVEGLTFKEAAKRLLNL